MNLMLRNDAGTRLGRLWDELDRDFDVLFSNNGKALSKMGYPRVDISETKSELKFEASLPGMTQKDVSVEYSEGVLSISGKSEKRNEDARYHYKELHRSQFTRAFSVPDTNFDVDKIDAKLENGLLTIIIPKWQEEHPKESVKRIEVK